MHYIDEGPKEASPILCLHGNPTWSFYWRAVIRAFAGRYRVIAPDHIGCGFSDKPQDFAYRLAQHVANIETLTTSLDLHDITLVMHDWGGAIAMGAAERLADRVRRFVITNTAAFLSPLMPKAIASARIPIFGALMVRGLNAFARAAARTAHQKPLPEAVRKGLLWPYDSWANRIATLRFVQDIPMKPGHPSYDTLKAIDENFGALADKPALVVWGEEDWCFTPQFRKEWEKRLHNAEIHALQGVGHYVCEDAPDALIAAMGEWMERT